MIQTLQHLHLHSAMLRNQICILKEILHIINRIHDAKSTCIVHLEWVSGHVNIERNEQTDKTDKAAAVTNTALIAIRMRSVQYIPIQSLIKA